MDKVRSKLGPQDFSCGTHVRARWRIAALDFDDDDRAMVVEEGELGTVDEVYPDFVVVVFESERIWVYFHELSIIHRTRFEMMEDLLV